MRDCLIFEDFPGRNFNLNESRLAARLAFRVAGEADPAQGERLLADAVGIAFAVVPDATVKFQQNIEKLLRICQRQKKRLSRGRSSSGSV